MPDFKKILEHVERDKIISKLVNGETPKDVAQYLKLKFNKKEEAHLRVGAALLQEFIDKYFDQYKFLNKVVEDEKSNKTDKIVYESLLNNKAWKERIADIADGEIDLKKRISDLIVRLEARAEQVFDKIQENPGNFKGDYVLLKYFDALTALLSTADKVINERPDTLIEHNISISMVEQNSVLIQDTIRELLLELSPDVSSRFMELLTAKLSKLSPDMPVTKYKTIEARGEAVDNIVPIALFEPIESDDYSFEVET
jgi:hypothetical protein